MAEAKRVTRVKLQEISLDALREEVNRVLEWIEKLEKSVTDFIGKVPEEMLEKADEDEFQGTKDRIKNVEEETQRLEAYAAQSEARLNARIQDMEQREKTMKTRLEEIRGKRI
ncbi:hypothetical protein OUZ56_023909 [Daphnia magna]|uniref:Uncharacterized protein n=1 Tax=Daphnia magna TaxID=35525 RepID=A0ABR0AZS5_9CRUS|nr:hypothetical protein OUZ56_023909 [Daphnia magna]